MSEMALTCLLATLARLSEDAFFGASLQRVVLPAVPWYTERALYDATLESVLVAVVVRVVQHRPDAAAHAAMLGHCIAVLANMAAGLGPLHPYAAARLAHLAAVCSARARRAHGTRAQESSAALALAALETVHCAVFGSRRGNAPLVYALLQAGPDAPALREPHPVPGHAYAAVARSMVRLLTRLQRELAATRPPPASTEAALALVSSRVPTHGRRSAPLLRYTFVEDEHADRFLLPFLWTLWDES